MNIGGNVMSLIGIDKSSLTDQIYKYLLDQIINNELPPGTRINYDELVDQLQVSRTPLREAINRLSDDRLIEIKPRSGTFVKRPTEKDITDVYEIRMSLERLSIELAYENLDKQVLKQLENESYEAEEAIRKGDVEVFFKADRNLHGTLIKYANNTLLTQFWRVIEAQIQWYGVIMTNEESPSKANEKHKEIIACLLDGKVEEAQQAMMEHLIEIKERMLNNNF